MRTNIVKSQESSKGVASRARKSSLEQSRFSQGKTPERVRGRQRGGAEYRSSTAGGMMANVMRSMSMSQSTTPAMSTDAGLMVQAKLLIGEPGDKYEQEADQVAKVVVQRINAPASRLKGPQHEDVENGTVVHSRRVISRMEQGAVGVESGAASPEFVRGLNRERGRGRALDGGLRAQVEPIMGADLRHVRVHTDGHADELSCSIQAKAFTSGQDVFFRKGAYEPGRKGGQTLLLHELTHVLQQNPEGMLRRETDPPGTQHRKQTEITDHQLERLTHQHGYVDNPSPDRLMALGGFEHKKRGAKGGCIYHIFKRRETNEFVLAFRGTSNIATLWADFEHPIAWLTYMWAERQIEEDLADAGVTDMAAQVTATGHSLGGLLTRRFAGRHKIHKAVMFQPPRVHEEDGAYATPSGALTTYARVEDMVSRGGRGGFRGRVKYYEAANDGLDEIWNDPNYDTMFGSLNAVWDKDMGGGASERALSAIELILGAHTSNFFDNATGELRADLKIVSDNYHENQTLDESEIQGSLERLREAVSPYQRGKKYPLSPDLVDLVAGGTMALAYRQSGRQGPLGVWPRGYTRRGWAALRRYPRTAAAVGFLATKKLFNVTTAKQHWKY